MLCHLNYLPEQSGYVTEALRHLHAAQDAAASESRQNARTLSLQQQVGGTTGDVIYSKISYLSDLFLGCFGETNSCSIIS